MVNLLLLLNVFLIPQSIRADETANQLKAYVDDFLSTVCKMRGFEKRKQQAYSNIPIIIRLCKKWSDDRIVIDPFMVAIIARYEASFKNRKKGSIIQGKRGELGIMQVMPDKITKKYDLNTPEGQLEAGIEKLRIAHEKCGKDPERVFTHYATGYTCKSKSEITQRKMKSRAKHYMKIIKKYKQ